MAKIVTLTKKLGGAAQHPYPYRIVIEGKLPGASAAAVKEQVMESIEDAANLVPGALIIHVTTLRNGTSPGVKNGKPHRSAGVAREQKQVSALMANMSRRGWSNATFNAKIEKLGLQATGKAMGMYPA